MRVVCLLYTSSHHIDSRKYGMDGGKKVKGRKEHIFVNTLGLPKMCIRDRIDPEPFTCAKSRTLRSSALAIRGVPRLLEAISPAA